MPYRRVSFLYIVAPLIIHVVVCLFYGTVSSTKGSFIQQDVSAPMECPAQGGGNVRARGERYELFHEGARAGGEERASHWPGQGTLGFVDSNGSTGDPLERGPPRGPVQGRGGKESRNLLALITWFGQMASKGFPTQLRPMAGAGTADSAIPPVSLGYAGTSGEAFEVTYGPLRRFSGGEISHPILSPLLSTQDLSYLESHFS